MLPSVCCSFSDSSSPSLSVLGAACCFLEFLPIIPVTNLSTTCACVSNKHSACTRYPTTTLCQKCKAKSIYLHYYFHCRTKCMIKIIKPIEDVVAQLVECLTLDRDIQVQLSTKESHFRSNLGQVVELHLLRSTKPFIPKWSIKLVPASAGG